MSVAVVPLIALPSSSSCSHKLQSCAIALPLLPCSSASCSSSLEIPHVAALSSIGLSNKKVAHAVVVGQHFAVVFAVNKNLRARVSVNCELVGSRVVDVCGLGKGDIGEWLEGSGGGAERRWRLPRRRKSGLFGMEDGGGGGVVRCGGICGVPGDIERNACVEGLGAFFKEGYELTSPLIVEKNRESTQTDSPVLNRLKEGFVRFKEEKFLKESELFSRLADGQQPKVMVIGCCDSWVDPTMLMELEPGEVFTLRNVANLVPPWEKEGTYHGTSAALEFAVMGLQVEHIIVLGHRHCGGIRALMTRSDFNSDFIGSWMKIGMSARERTFKVMAGKPITDQCHFCEQESINASLANLLTFSWIEDRVKHGKLRLHGWYYDFVDGSMVSWEVKRQQYGSPTPSSPSLMSTTGYN